MRELLDQANKAPMIERPRWIAWTALALLMIAAIGIVASIRHH